MPLSPEVKEIVDALTASARGQMASSAGLEKVDTRLREVEGAVGNLATEVHDLVEELKIANVIERTGQEIEAKKIEHVSQFANRAFDWIARVAGSKPAIAFYMLLIYGVLTGLGISPSTVRAFIVTYLGGGAPTLDMPSPGGAS